LSDDGKLAAEKLSARRFRIINNPRLSNFQLSGGGFLKEFFQRVNYRAASSGESEHRDENSFISKASPPNVLIGGPVPISPGFPIEAFGNDGL